MPKLFVIIVLLFSVNLFSDEGQRIAKKLGLSASSKVSMQWDRVFKKEKKMLRYGIDKLNDNDKNLLKIYLLNHAADSDAPEAAGM